MLDVKKAALVARFELLEALRSRLVALLVLLYGGGAMLGSRIFLGLLSAAEDATREALAADADLPPSALPEDLVREKAMPWLIGFVQDDATREQLLRMDPLSIFFGYASLKTVAVLVLLIATASIAQDVERGATRFLLFRCDRLSWTLGKTVGQAVLLLAGLGLAALGTLLVGTWVDGAFDLSRLGWLLVTALRSWVYGLAYLGIFSAISMVSKTPLRARAGALLAWLCLGIGHAVLTSDWLAELLPFAQYAAYLLPAEHQAALWSSTFAVHVAASAALLSIGAASFYGGYQVFEGRDA